MLFVVGLLSLSLKNGVLNSLHKELPRIRLDANRE